MITTSISDFRKDIKFDENKRVIISTTEKVINLRDILVSIFVFGMVIYLIFQIFIQWKSVMDLW